MGQARGCLGACGVLVAACLLSCRQAGSPELPRGRWAPAQPAEVTMEARLAEERAVDETCRRIAEVASFPPTGEARAGAEKRTQAFLEKALEPARGNGHGRVALARAAFLLSMQLANDIEAQATRAAASLGWLSLLVQPVVSRLTAEVAAWSVEQGMLAIQDRQGLPSLLFSAEACRYYGGTEPRSTVARAVARRLIVRHASEASQGRANEAHEADCRALSSASVWQGPGEAAAQPQAPSPTSCEALVGWAVSGAATSERGARRRDARCGGKPAGYTSFTPASDEEGGHAYSEEGAKRAFEAAQTACLGLGQGPALCATEQVSAVAGAMILASTEAPGSSGPGSAAPTLAPSDFQAMMSKLHAIEQSTLGIQRRLDDLSGLAATSKSLSESLDEAKKTEATLRSQLRDAERVIARLRASEASQIRQARVRVAKLFVPELKVDAQACDQPQASGGAVVSNFVVSLENLCSLTTPLVILASWGGFSPGNTGLPATWEATLSQVARELSPEKGRPAFQVAITGHSDCTPVTALKKDADGWWDEASRSKEVDTICEAADVDCRRQVGISWKRASDVAKKLRAAGITAVVQARGTSSPVCRSAGPCDRVDEACKQQNRRIALSLSSSSLMLSAP